ncbi:MAG: aldehyde dehydrogenase family protein [Planctomycetota bacterium]|nr:aldehyde dehydrogenase family protein [Planctomycetota bacterium]
MPEQAKTPKTYRLLIDGVLVGSESQRTIDVTDRRDRVIARVGRASAKDVQRAIDAARAVQPSWAHRDAFERGRIIHRLAEAVEDTREDLAAAIASTSDATPAAARREVDASIDRLVSFAGWADKYASVLGGRNPVAGPYYSFTDPEPMGVVAVIAPDEPGLLGLVTLLAAPLCAGNTIVALGSGRSPLPAALFGEACAEAAAPAGVMNILTGAPAELLEFIALHRSVDAISAANLRKRQATMLRMGTAENVKRVEIDRIGREQWLDAEVCASAWRIEPFVQAKTIRHPSAMT